MQKKKNNILLTGGHAATTALAVVQELQKDAKWNISWVGTKYAMEGKRVMSLESQELAKMGVKSYPIISGKLQRRWNLWAIISLFKLPIGFFHAFYLVLKIKPRLVLSFGGFAAFPVVLASYILGIPVVIHEQTSTVGRANKYTSYFAKKIAISRDESAKFFPKQKVVLVGNPILKQIRRVKVKEKIGRPPALLIMGGSRGSRNINEVVVRTLPKLLEKFRVVHITGSFDFENTKKSVEGLNKTLSQNYEIRKFVVPELMGEIYKKVDMIIARSGANTVAEIIYTKRPTIFIPLPFSYADEQYKNALFAKRYGIADIIEEKDLDDKVLLNKVIALEASWQQIVRSVKKKPSPDTNAAEKLARLIEGVIR